MQIFSNGDFETFDMTLNNQDDNIMTLLFNVAKIHYDLTFEESVI